MHSFNSCLVHCVWSTKNRVSFLDSDLRNRLWPYLGGIARDNKMKALAIGGAADHVHILVSLPEPCRSPRQYNFSKAILQNGFTKHSQDWQDSPGNRATARSA